MSGNEKIKQQDSILTGYLRYRKVITLGNKALFFSYSGMKNHVFQMLLRILLRVASPVALTLVPGRRSWYFLTLCAVILLPLQLTVILKRCRLSLLPSNWRNYRHRLNMRKTPTVGDILDGSRKANTEDIFSIVETFIWNEFVFSIWVYFLLWGRK